MKERAQRLLALLAISAFALAPSAIAAGDNSVPTQADAAKQSAGDNPIRRANRLHEEATVLFHKQYFDEAIAKEKEAADLAPSYWLPHAAMGYMYFGRGGPAMQEAEESTKSDHPALADVNLGLLLQYFHVYDKAIVAFKRVPEDDPQYPLAKVGTATCLMRLDKQEEGRKLLDEVYASAPKDPFVLAALARTFFDIGEMARVQECCRTALASSPSADTKAMLTKLMLIAAVNTSDLSTVDSLKDSVRKDMEQYEAGWLRATEFQFAKTPHDALIILRFAETEETTDLHWLSYACALQHKADAAQQSDKDKWMQIEKTCLDKCAAAEPNNVDIRIMSAALAERMGQKQLALKEVLEGWSNVPIEPSANVIHANDQLSRVDVSTLAKSFVKEGKDYRSSVSMIQCKLPKVTCHCRYDRFKEAVRSAPGVFNVVIGPGDTPTSLILFDSRKASKKSIFESVAVVSLKEKLDIGEEKPIKTITELGDLIAQFTPPLHEPVFFLQNVSLQFPTPGNDAQKAQTRVTAR